MSLRAASSLSDELTGSRSRFSKSAIGGLGHGGKTGSAVAREISPKAGARPLTTSTMLRSSLKVVDDRRGRHAQDVQVQVALGGQAGERRHELPPLRQVLDCPLLGVVDFVDDYIRR